MNIRLLVILAALPLAGCTSDSSPAAGTASKGTGASNEPLKVDRSNLKLAGPKLAVAKMKEAPVGKPDAEGKVQIRATADDFIPSRIEVKGGEKVTLVFLREVEKSCMSKVVFPSLDIEKALPVGEKVEIEITAPESGSIAFQCPMAMGKSAIVVL